MVIPRLTYLSQIDRFTVAFEEKSLCIFECSCTNLSREIGDIWMLLNLKILGMCLFTMGISATYTGRLQILWVDVCLWCSRMIWMHLNARKLHVCMYVCMALYVYIYSVYIYIYTYYYYHYYYTVYNIAGSKWTKLTTLPSNRRQKTLSIVTAILIHIDVVDRVIHHNNPWFEFCGENRGQTHCVLIPGWFHQRVTVASDFFLPVAWIIYIWLPLNTAKQSLVPHGSVSIKPFVFCCA